ncbi:MAG TPA: 3-phosphoshikimate 1-carboxyvinyltransferase [Gemmatimonadales bacterium]
MIARGRITVPGDKSITHRVLMLGALSDGVCPFEGALAAGDTRASAACLRALGICAGPLRDGRALMIHGRGLRPFRKPGKRLDARNSGTTARLLMGLLSAHPFAATITGDASLRRRPMARVAAPLESMGARLTSTGGRLPLTVRGGTLRELDYTSPVASAQVKTALLFAGLAGGVRVSVSEPVKSRDHTERMLQELGVPIAMRGSAGGVRVELHPVPGIPPFGGVIPGDFSSAAYLIATAVLAKTSELSIEGVNVNPTRTGLLRAIARMGAAVEVTDERNVLGEPVATLHPRSPQPAALVPVCVEPAEVPSMVDEIPLLACVASRVSGTSVFRGVGELRVKESDRLALVARNLEALGVRSWAEADTLWVEGTDAPPRGRIETAGDHRLAMSFAVLGTLPGARVRLDDRDCVAISYPGFFDTLKAILHRA